MTVVLITGANGQAGWELQRTCPPSVSLHTLDLPELDITNEKIVNETIDSIKPDVVINAAAYTAVDKAEEESEVALLVNGSGAGFVAAAAQRAGSRIIHFSTDFVFDGEKTTPYLPDDKPNPLSVYGSSKLAGEKAVMEATQGQGLIIRTSWLYSSHGANFVKTMLRLFSEGKDVSIVADQYGCPTWAKCLAEVTWAFSERPDLCGFYHWTDQGETNWFEFAKAIQDEALAQGIIKRAAKIDAIAGKDYGAPAPRPAYSVLDLTKTCSALSNSPRNWKTSLREMLNDI